MYVVGLFICSGECYKNSGYNNDSIGFELFNLYFLGENIYVECVENIWEYVMGILFVFVVVGGLFIFLVLKYWKLVVWMIKIS